MCGYCRCVHGDFEALEPHDLHSPAATLRYRREGTTTVAEVELLKVVVEALDGKARCRSSPVMHCYPCLAPMPICD